MNQYSELKRHFFLDHPLWFGIGCFVLNTALSYLVLIPPGSVVIPYSPEGAFLALAVHILLAAAFAVLFKKALRHGFIIGFTGKKLAKCLILGWILIFLSLQDLYEIKIFPFGPLQFTVPQVLTALFLSVYAAVREEILYRGLTASNMMRVWGQKPMGICAAMAGSALVFGASHAVNAVGTGFNEGIVWQMAYTFGLGFVFAAVYFRTRNLWGLIILHGLLDFTGLFAVSETGSADPIGDMLSASYSASEAACLCLYIAVFIAYSFYLVRPAIHPEIRARWNYAHQERKKAAPSAIAKTART